MGGAYIGLSNKARKVSKMYIGVPNPEYRDDLPDGYRQIEYLASNGTPYIDLGFSGNATSISAQFDYMRTDTQSSNRSVFGFLTSSNSNGFGMLHTSSNATRFWAYGSSYSSITNVSSNTKHSVTMTYSSGSRSQFKVDNSTAQSSDSPSGSKTIPALYLFHTYRTDSSYSRLSMRVYNFKLTVNGVMIRDMIPCIRTSDSEIGMYDVSQPTNTSKTRFYTNANSSGAFTAGPDVGTGIAREISKAYVGVANKARLFWPASRLPSGYTEIEYITLTDNYTETTIPYSGVMRFDAQMKFTSSPSNYAQLPIGIGISSGIVATAQYMNGSWRTVFTADTSYVDYVTSSDYSISNITSTSYLYSIRVGSGKNNASLYLDGSNKGTTSNYSRTVTPTLISLYGGATFYSGAVYNSSNQVIGELVPCKNSSNQVGVYDLVTNTFTSLTGTAGPNV